MDDGRAALKKDDGAEELLEISERRFWLIR